MADVKLDLASGTSLAHRVRGLANEMTRHPIAIDRGGWGTEEVTLAALAVAEAGKRIAHSAAAEFESIAGGVLKSIDIIEEVDGLLGKALHGGD